MAGYNAWSCGKPVVVNCGNQAAGALLIAASVQCLVRYLPAYLCNAWGNSAAINTWNALAEQDYLWNAWGYLFLAELVAALICAGCSLFCCQAVEKVEQGDTSRRQKKLTGAGQCLFLGYFWGTSGFIALLVFLVFAGPTHSELLWGVILLFPAYFGLPVLHIMGAVGACCPCFRTDVEA